MNEDQQQDQQQEVGAQPPEVVPEEVRQRLATVAMSLAITPPQSRRRGGLIGIVTGEQETTAPSITDALKIARFALDDYRSIEGVDQPDAPDGVTAEDLLEHFTRNTNRKDR